MKVIDLTHTIYKGMPVYPGTEGPKLDVANTKVLSNNMVIIENLTNLSEIGNELFTFCALPLKFENSDGAPVRAIAIVK